MSLSLTKVTAAAPSDWDAIWQACDYATWFHSRAWSEIWSAYQKGRTRPEPLLATFSDGQRAVLPLTARPTLRGLARRYLSSPGGTYGGWISADPLTGAHAALLGNFQTQDLGPLEWRLNPYDPVLREVPVPGAEPDDTHAIDLRPGFEAATRGRSKANKAARAGVTVVAAASEEDWRAYFALYEKSLTRWGGSATSRYRWPLFEAIRTHPTSGARLWLARFQDQFIAGALCFYARRHVVYWHGAADEAHFELRPVNLLMQEAIRDACGRGAVWFDLNPSGGHEGVRQFKRSLGGESLPSPVVRVRGNWKTGLRQTWRRLFPLRA